MPCFKIFTNVRKSNIPKEFVNKIIPILASCVGKESEKFICAVIGDVPLSFGGDSQSLGAVATLESIGNLDRQQNQAISKALSDFAHVELGIHPSRFFISFYDMQSHNIGKDGTTAEILLQSSLI